MPITSFRYRGDRTVSYQAERECGWLYGTSRDGQSLLQLET